MLLDRDDDLAVLDAAVAAAVASNGGVVIIEGPAGIGKTRLLAEVRGRAAGAMEVLSARGSELERDFPFGVVRQLFERAVAGRPLEGGAEPAGAVFASVGGAGASFAILHGLQWLALDLAEARPLLLAVDDLQWCDEPSLRFLAYLSRRLEGAPILLAATLRTTDPGSALVAELTADPFTTVVAPAALTGEAVAAMIEARLGRAHPAFADACAEATGGNPLLLELLLTALRSDGVDPGAGGVGVVREIGPRAVARTVQLRLARLSPAAIEVARTVAVLDGGAAPEPIAALTGLSRTEIADAARALAGAEILRPDAFAFVHPLLRDAVYAELSAVEREPRHVLASRVLRAAGAPDDQIAVQLLSAPPMGEPWAAELLADVGRGALAQGAGAAAVTYLARAAAETSDPDPPLLLDLGRAEALTGLPGAVEHLREAYERGGEPEAALLLGRLLMVAGHSDAFDRFMAGAAADASPQVARELLALELLGAWHAFAPPETLVHAAEYRALPADPRVADLMLASLASLEWALTGGPADRCVALALAALADGRLIEYDTGHLSYAAIMVLLIADRAEALPELDRALEIARRRGSLHEVYAAHAWRGLTQMHHGELDEALADLAASRDALALTVDPNPETWTYLDAHLANVLLERGDLTAARATLAGATLSPPGVDGMRYLADAELGLLVAEGEPERVLTAADAFAGTYALWIGNPVHAGFRSAKAWALRRLGREAEARVLAEEELELARAFGAPGGVAAALRAVGGLDRLEEAVRITADTPARLEHVKAQVALGRALRLDRRPREAREPLAQALAFCAAHGIAGLAEVARAELEATGARPRRDALSGVAALTPSERRVADLAAAGGSNRDIAQTLYVTPKTVELHLRNAYRKLDIAGRRELPAALADT